MAIITQIQMPTGTTYDIQDQGARDLIAAINNWSYIVCTNAANTPKDVTWTSGSTTITGTLVASADTMYKIYLVPDTNGTNDVYDEYITVNPSGSTYKWEMFGNTKLPDMNDYLKNKTGHSGGTAGDLAYYNTVTVTPQAKTVSVSGTPKGSISVGTGTANYTPSGSNASSSVSGSCTVTATGNVSSTFTGTGVRLQTDSQVLTGASFSGSSMTSTGTLTASVVDVKPNSSGTSANKYTPAGSISVGTGTANYTPAGNVTLATAGSTDSITPVTKKTVVLTLDSPASSSTTPSGTVLDYATVSGTKLVLNYLTKTTGDSVTTGTAKTFKTGDGAYSFGGTGAELKFTGTATYLKTASYVVSNSSNSVSVSVSGTTAGSITPTKSNVTVSPAASGTATYTPEGTIESTFTGTSATGTISGTAAAQTFTGSGVELKFTGSSTSSSGSYTPATPTVSYS